MHWMVVYHEPRHEVVCYQGKAEAYTDVHP